MAEDSPEQTPHPMSLRVREDQGVAAAPVAQPSKQWQGLFRKRHPLVLLYTGDGKGKTLSLIHI